MSDFFVSDEEKIVEVKKRQVSISDKPSMEHLAIKLSSVGKLSLPKVIHIKNYTGQDSLELSQAPSAKELETLLQVVDRMVFEEIDVLELHQSELEEIMLNVYLNWWGKSLTSSNYAWDKEELDQALNKNLIGKEEYDLIENGSKNLTVDVKISNINTKVINNEFKEPIILKKDNHVYKFRLPRLGDFIKAENFVEIKYLESENTYINIQKDIEYNKRNKNNVNVKQRTIDSIEHRNYLEYMKKRNVDLLSLQEMYTILEIDNVMFTTEEDKIEAYKDIPLDIIVMIEKVISDIEFGPQSDVTIESPLTHDKVIRRFQFRAVDYLPTMEIQDDSRYTVLFGEQ